MSVHFFTGLQASGSTSAAHNSPQNANACVVTSGTLANRALNLFSTLGSSLAKA